MKVYYFGCVEQAGHYLWDTRFQRHYWGSAEALSIPWLDKLDGGLCPVHNREVEGEALLHVMNGWTAIAFWDRSVDKRGKCNSSFIAEGVHTFDEMRKIAEENFPKVWSRFPFKITEFQAKQNP